MVKNVDSGRVQRMDSTVMATLKIVTGAAAGSGQ